tara:strand:- start:1340 stop:2002 length:663 start_codon:yes stop_codon:yes gene_type:complete
MSRLFVTEREINFINDTAKEIVKDVIGQKIYYFSVSEVKSKVHDVYEEAIEKVFEEPIELDALVKYSPQEIRANKFGSEEFFTIEVYVQKRDLIDKGIAVLEGDFFSYGSVFFEVIKAPDSNTIYGQVEYKSFLTLTGKQARKGQFITKILGPTDESHTDTDAVQKTFVQQRGFKKNRLGDTGDIRDLRQNGVLDDPISGPKEVSTNSSGPGSSFYGEKE